MDKIALGIQIDYGVNENDYSVAIVTLHYNNTLCVIYQTDNKEQIKALDEIRKIENKKQETLQRLEQIDNAKPSQALEEALERLYCSGSLQLDYVLSNKHKQDYEIIEQALTELQAIREANPSEALERTSGEFIDGYPTGNVNVGMTWEEHSTIKQALQRLEQYDEIVEEFKDLPFEQRLEFFKHDIILMPILEEYQEQEKVLDIIKEKPQAELNLIQIGKIKTYEEYLKYTEKWDSYWWEYEYTEEEFELLKRHFK